MSAMKKSILIITNLYPVPWAPNRASFNKQQFDLLSEQVQVSIIILVPWLEWFKHKKQWQEHDNIVVCPYFYLPKIGRRWVPSFQYFALLGLRTWIKKLNPELILATWGFPDAVASARLAKHLKLPLLAKVHGTDINENCLVPSRARQIKRWLNTAKGIFCPSQALGQLLINTGIEAEKICVNYNGVNADVFYPLAKKATNKAKIIFVGSLIPTKGVNELLAAFLVLARDDKDTSLDIVGDGPMLSHIQTWVKQNKLIDRVNVTGSIPLPKVAEHIRSATLLVLPSYREGVPNVLLEAFASGTPVIATKVGGIPEVVTQDTGILVDAKNSAELAKAMRAGLDKSWQQNKILTHAQTFNWQKNVDTVIELIES